MYFCAQTFIYQILPKEYTLTIVLLNKAGNCTEPSIFLLVLQNSTWCEQVAHWKRPWWWERLKPEGEEGDRGWDGWMASLTWWTWVWASSGSWWWTGKPGMLQSMGSQRVGHDWSDWTSLSQSLLGTKFIMLVPHQSINLYPVMCVTSLEYSCYSPVKLLHILGVSQ